MVPPWEAYAEIGNLLEQVVKKPFRDEPMTEAEMDIWTDKILMWAQDMKEASHERRTKG